MLNLKTGAAVQVSHDGGIELGLIESINYNSGKVLVAFGEGINLNFCLFNISQVKAGA